MRRSFCLALCAVLGLSGLALAADPPEKVDASKLPHINVDVKKKQLRVEAEFVNADMPLEFFVCMSGTAEHETVLRSPAKPSHIHLGLLMLGLQPGEPVRFSKAADKWIPPSGPPLHISVEFVDKKGKTVSYPAYRLMQNVKTKKEMPAMSWIFCGSRVMEDGKYAADTTGYMVTVVNFDLALIDIPDLASNANETLEWKFNPDLCPDRGTKATLVIEPVGKGDPDKGKTQGNAGDSSAATTVAVSPAKDDQRVSDVTIDEKLVRELRAKWDATVKPHAKALREATETHYKVMERLRQEQNRLIDEADRIQRVMDLLQKEFQDMTTPKPELEKKE